MKKLIAVSVALALVAGSAFAEITWSGLVETSVTLVRDFDEDNLMGIRPGGAVRLQAAGTREGAIGTFGMLARVQAAPAAGGTMNGHVWWEPAGPIFRFGIGTELGGFVDTIGRQGYFRAVPGIYMHLGGWSGTVGGAIHHNRAFMGNDGAGLSARLLPMGDMLQIGVHVPYPTAATRTYRIFAGTAASNGIRGSVRVDLDVGRIGFGYAAYSALDGTDFPAGVLGTAAVPAHRDEHNFFGFFHTGMVAGLGLDVGVRFGLNTEDDTDNRLDAGVGVNFGLNDDVDIRFRGSFGMILGDGSDWFGPQIGIEVMPSITFGDMRFCFNAGLGIDLPGSETNRDPVIHFIVNPQLRVNLGAPSFGVGFQLRGRSYDGETDIAWGIPIGFAFSF